LDFFAFSNIVRLGLVNSKSLGSSFPVWRVNI
jgi:hypothetical protein